jgi:allantoicase
MNTTDTSAATATTITKLTDLAAEKLGGKMLSRSNDFFSDMENLIKAGLGIFIADK